MPQIFRSRNHGPADGAPQAFPKHNRVVVRGTAAYDGAMAFRLNRDEPLAEAVRRIALEQIDKVLGEVRGSSLRAEDKIHQARRRCKKIRALLRLVRPAIPDHFAEQNALFRDAARRLGALRDADALIEAHDTLVAGLPGQADREAFASVRAQLVRRRDRDAPGGHDIGRHLDDFARAMDSARRGIPRWRPRTDPGTAIRQGMARTYARGRGAMVSAGVRTEDELLHDWRKRVKYTRHHIELLRDLWIGPFRPRRRDYRRLSDLLGHDHDLAVLLDTLSREDAIPRDASPHAYRDLLTRRRARLQRQSFRLGRRLYALKPRRLAALLNMILPG